MVLPDHLEAAGLVPPLKLFQWAEQRRSDQELLGGRKQTRLFIPRRTAPGRFVTCNPRQARITGGRDPPPPAPPPPASSTARLNPTSPFVFSPIIFAGRSGKALRDLAPLVSPLNFTPVSCKSSRAAAPISGHPSPGRREGEDGEVLPVTEEEDGRRGNSGIWDLEGQNEREDWK